MKYLDGNYFAWQAKQTGKKVVGESNPFLSKMIKMKDAAPTWVCKPTIYQMYQHFHAVGDD